MWKTSVGQDFSKKKNPQKCLIQHTNKAAKWINVSEQIREQICLDVPCEKDTFHTQTSLIRYIAEDHRNIDITHSKRESHT